MSESTPSLTNGAAVATPPPAAVLPPLYKRLEPLTSERHARLRVRPASLSFAEEATAIPLAAEEFLAAARSLPIVFAAQAPHMPVAVTGLTAGKNLYLEPDGKWRHGAYIPAYLRRYPFFLVRTAPGSDQLALCIDPGSALFSETEGEALFTAEGKPSPALDRALAFCRATEEAALRTKAMTEGLAELGLLKPAVVQFAPQGRPLRVDGFYAVDRPSLMALPAEKLAELRDRGWLEAIYAHLLSIGGLSDLAEKTAVPTA